MEKLIVLSGHARAGKDTLADYICDFYKDKKCIKISFAYYIKDYLKRMGIYNEKEKDRTLLQTFGKKLKEIDEDILIRRVCEDIKVFSSYDVIIVTDARLKSEIKMLKEYENTIFIKVVNKEDNGLTEKQKKDITETDLDDISFDYVIDINNKKEVEKILWEK